MKLTLGIPTAGSPAQPFLESLRTLVLPQAVTGFSNISVTGNFVPAQRELIVRSALRSGADFLMMIDDDIVLPPDALTSLYHVFETDPRCGLAGGLYYSRDGFRPMAVSNWTPNDTANAHTPAFATNPVEVDAVGFGCVLIDCRVFRALAEPYFRAQILLEEQHRRARLCNEDYLFCHALREQGFAVYLHPGVRLGHYDRASAVTVPAEWEPPERTAQARMSVRKSDGSVELVALDERLTRAGERHVPVTLDYVFPESG